MEFRRPSRGSNTPQLPRPRGWVYLLIVALILTGIYLLVSPETFLNQKSEQVPITQILRELKDDQVKSVELRGNMIKGTTKDEKIHISYLPTGERWNEWLKDNGVNLETSGVEVKTFNEASDRFWLDLLSSLLPFGIIILVLFFMLRQAQSGASSALSFGKSTPRVHDKSKDKTTFADVAGAEEAKQELMEIVDFLKNPKKYLKMGAKIPKGVLLVGAPGTGKTLLARAVAGEADVPFFSISGSEFVEMFVGVGASRVRDLFTKAKRNAPSIVFVDEIDAVGRQRGTGLGGGHDEREQTLNQILTEMDGFEKDTNVIVMAATNRPDVLDPALMRPGRFDRRVVIDKPDLKERESILRVHARNKPMAKDVDLHNVAKQTPGFSGADLENMLNEAAILAAKLNAGEITTHMVQESVEKVLMGPEKRNRVMSDQEKKITAYHETGHALVGHLMPEHDPIHKITIIPRGFSLGGTWHLPERDQFMNSKTKFESELASLMGGRVAEELVFGKDNITTGAGNDLERASEIARRMVTEYGMSEKLGPVVFGEKQGSVFLGRDMMAHKNYSEDVARQIDEEVSSLLEKAYKNAKTILTDNKEKMGLIAEQLLKKETLLREEFLAFFGQSEETPKKRGGRKTATGLTGGASA